MGASDELVLSPDQQERERREVHRLYSIFRWSGALLAAGVVIAAGALVVHLVREERTADLHVQSKNALKQAGVYFSLYESRFNSWPPDAPTAKRFLQEQSTDTVSLLHCQACGRELTFQRDSPPASASSGTGGTSAEFPLAWHSCPRTGKTLVLFRQGRVDEVADWAPSAGR